MGRNRYRVLEVSGIGSFSKYRYRQKNPIPIPSIGKWGKVMTRGKVIFGPTGFDIQMTSFNREQKLVILHVLLDIF